ncbi:MAG: hypothetical protein AB7I48_25210 [Planctomycetaceae bacterium]
MNVRGILIAGLLMVAAGCGGNDRRPEGVTAARPAESAGSPPEDQLEPAGGEPQGCALPGAAAPEGDDWATAGAEPLESAFPDAAPVSDEPPAGAWEGHVGTAPGAIEPRAGAASLRPRSFSSFDDAEPAASPVDEFIKRLRDGGMVYNAPETMQYGEPADLELLISPAQSVESLLSQLRDASNARTDTVSIGNRMEAALTGAGFSIEALSPELQAVSSTKPTRWRWRVTPTRHGRQELHLSLHAHIDVDGRDTPYVVETKDAVIEVNITVGQRIAGFVGKNWQWLWAAVVLPVCGFRLRRRKRSDEETPRRAAA